MGYWDWICHSPLKALVGEKRNFTFNKVEKYDKRSALVGEKRNFTFNKVEKYTHFFYKHHSFWTEGPFFIFNAFKRGGGY